MIKAIIQILQIIPHFTVMDQMSETAEVAVGRSKEQALAASH